MGNAKNSTNRGKVFCRLKLYHEKTMVRKNTYFKLGEWEKNSLLYKMFLKLYK